MLFPHPVKPRPTMICGSHTVVKELPTHACRPPNSAAARSQRKIAKPRTRIHDNLRAPDSGALYAQRPFQLGCGQIFGAARKTSLHARHTSRHVSQSSVDHAPIRRIWLRAGHEPALPLFAIAGSIRAIRRFRFTDADGL